MHSKSTRNPLEILSKSSQSPLEIHSRSAEGHLDDVVRQLSVRGQAPVLLELLVQDIRHGTTAHPQCLCALALHGEAGVVAHRNVVAGQARLIPVHSRNVVPGFLGILALVVHVDAREALKVQERKESGTMAARVRPTVAADLEKAGAQDLLQPRVLLPKALAERIVGRHRLHYPVQRVLAGHRRIVREHHAAAGNAVRRQGRRGQQSPDVLPRLHVVAARDD
eukprot:scaffold8536_cov248-Pinguiococcus_pyrenoidosus.AAC.12